MGNDKSKSDYEGLQEDVRELKIGEIEVWENKYSDHNYIVRLEVLEFSCICPKTGLPDYAQIEVEYIPDKLCIELKSFKLYLTGYRNVGIFHEHVINKIGEDIVSACQPRWLRIRGIFNIRGGIRTTVEWEYNGNNMGQ